MTTRLKIYNEALRICGERALASLTENREPRHLLDNVWDADGVKACLESGQWKFAMRAVRIDYDTNITPDFGYQRAFQKPSDWCLTSSVSEDEYFNTPLTQYSDEAGYWYAECDVLYVKYVSNNGSWGGDLSTWTTRFADYVASHFAAKIIFKLTSDKENRNDVIKWEKMKKTEAKSLDAMADPTKFPPEGGWSRSRRGGSSKERGRRSSLIG